VFIRFVVGGTDEHHRALTGVITEARLLRDRGKLSASEAAHLDESYAWFNENLPVPPFDVGRWPRDVVAWFKHDRAYPCAVCRRSSAFCASTATRQSQSGPALTWCFCGGGGRDLNPRPSGYSGRAGSRGPVATRTPRSARPSTVDRVPEAHGTRNRGAQLPVAVRIEHKRHPEPELTD
jgi:hypothetical protein